MGRVDKSKLKVRRLETVEVEIPDLGTFVIRALTRADVIEARRLALLPDGKVDPAENDNHLLSLALVDPEMTAAEVDEWGANAPAGEQAVLLEKIRDVSKLKENSFRPDVPGNRQQRRARK